MPTTNKNQTQDHPKTNQQHTKITPKTIPDQPKALQKRTLKRSNTNDNIKTPQTPQNHTIFIEND